MAYSVRDSSTLLLSQTSSYQAVSSQEPFISKEEPDLRSNSCSLKYRVRWFSSRAVFLILIWNALVTFSSQFLYTSYLLFASNQPSNSTASFLASELPFFLWGIVAPFAGWLADVYLGTYRVFKVGVLLLFFSSVMNCVLFQLVGHGIIFNGALFVSLFVIFSVLSFSSFCICLVTVVTLGLHQMPDASTSDITSFIAWFVCSLEAGYWVCHAVSLVPPGCMEVFNADDVRIWTLFPVLAVSIILVSDSFLAPKWLIIEPKSRKSLKTIFQVLKFAAKHKSPLRRSAFTYWEEDIPSRIDLGKSKYGGPFSTEQVEDVKVILRLLAISVPVFLIIEAFFMEGLFISELNMTKCENTVLQYVICNVDSVIVFGTFAYELLVYPFIGQLLPSILKRIGIGAFLVVVVNITFFVLYIVQTFETHLSWPWLSCLQLLITGVLKFIWMTSTLELVVAQSPYNMRGLSVGFFWCLFLITRCFIDLEGICEASYCGIAYGAVAVALSIVGFVLYCVLAGWYKLRVRDDIATPHKWAEETYDRYLRSGQ